MVESHQERRAKAVLCEDIEGLRDECRTAGLTAELETVVADALAGRPVVAGLLAMGVDVTRGAGWTSLPGLVGGGSRVMRYGCPHLAPCLRVSPAEPGSVPRCRLDGTRMLPGAAPPG